MVKYILLLLCVASVMAVAEEKSYKVSFGVILKNELGEPIGFQETRSIPLGNKSQSTLFGVVVTKVDEQPFMLGTVHIIPSKEQGKSTKIMGKPMRSMNRGAVFLQSDEQDIPGDYRMEIYLDNRLVQTIEYQLIVTNSEPQVATQSS